MSEPLSIDLFAGAGGATQGLVDASFRVVCAIESDPTSTRTYRANHPEVHLLERDIREVDPAALAEELDLRPGDLALLTACPPCQGFSTLGRSNSDDPRNELVGEIVRFVDTFAPQAILLENVPGLASDARLASLGDALEVRDYVGKTYIVNASGFGVPQRRRRLVFVALEAGLASSFPESLFQLLPPGFDIRPPTAGEAIAAAGPIDGSGDPVHRARTSTPEVHARLRAIPVGGGRFDLPPELQLKCHARLKGRAATSIYSRIRADDLAPTMTTRCTTPSCGRFVHPTDDRGISLREAALLQTFPLSYHFEGSYAEIERQIGNAVPVRMAHGLGLCISALVERVSHASDGAIEVGATDTASRASQASVSPAAPRRISGMVPWAARIEETPRASRRGRVRRSAARDSPGSSPR